MPDTTTADLGMAIQNSITILHISDVQFGRNHRFGNLAAGGVDDDDADTQFDTLFMRLDTDLKGLIEKDPRMKPQMIVVSGDLAEWGRRTEFRDALEFLDRLTKGLEVPRRRVVIVPGNHDINRKACESYFLECEADEREPTEPFARKWEPFLRMFEDFYGEESDVAFTVEEPWTLWEIEDLKLVVAGLNSTMRESHRAEDQYGHVGEHQLRWFAERLDPYIQRGWFRLGVVHHNTTPGSVADDECLRDASLLGEILAPPQLNLLLHGHTHNSTLTWLGEVPLPVLSTGSAALKSKSRPPEVPNQYQLLRLHAEGIERWTRRYDPGRTRWAGDTSCSPGADEWQIAYETPFEFVEGTFDGLGVSLHEPDEITQPDHRSRSRPRAPVEGFLSRVLEICELRYRDEGTRVDVISEPQQRPYLRVQTRDESVAQSFPIGIVEGDVSGEIVARFCTEVFDRYRAFDPSLRCTIVYGGEHASEDIIQAAGARNVDLRSFVEFQGIVDFRGYVRRQTARLTSDIIYPPELYVPQQLIYDVGTQRRTSPDALSEMVGWLREPRARFVLVLGDFGAGKTFLLRELARRMPEEIPHLVPVLVDLRSLEKARTLEQLVAQHLATAGERFIDLEAFPYMLRQGRIALLFDGFDELAMRVTYKRATEHFETLLQATGGDAKVVVTSRTQHFESDQQAHSQLLERAELLPGLSLCRIQPFDEPQIRAFLGRRLGSEQEAVDRYALIDEIKDLLGLSHNPRMLGFIAGIPEDRLREARERTGTITAAALYRLLIDQWLDYEWTKTQPRGAAPTLSPEERWEAVTALALCLWAKIERTIHISELTEQVSVAFQRLGADPTDGVSLDPDTIAHLVGSRTLLVRDEDGAFAFVHASVMEWFVANDAASQLVDGAQPTALGQREMTPLMADFVCDLAGPEYARVWAREAIAADERSPARYNGLLVLDRLGEQAHDASLAGENLSGRDLSEQDLAGARLVGADLTEARLGRTDLTRADLTGATLVRADFTRAVLAYATLERADLRSARLLGADLRGARLQGANLRRAKLIGTQLTDPEADFVECDTFGAALPTMCTPEPTLATAASPAVAVAMHPTGEVIVTGHSDGTVRIWDPLTGTELRTLAGHEGVAWGIAVSPAGTLIASAGMDSTVRLWDPESGAARQTLASHVGWVRGVAFSRDGGLLASVGDDAKVRLWNSRDGTEVHSLVGHKRLIRGVAFSPTEEILASASDDGTVRLWDPRAGEQLLVISGHRRWIMSLAFSRDGEILATTGDDGTVRLWNPHTGEELQTIVGHGALVMGVAFSPDGKILATSGDDATVRLWDPHAGTQLHAMAGHEGWVRGVTFSQDGGILVSVGDDTTVRLWDSRSGAVLQTLSGHKRGVRDIAFSPDGQTFISAGDDSYLRIWNPMTWTKVDTFDGHDGRVNSIAFSTGGEMLATGGDDAVVRLWNPMDGSIERTLSGPTGSILALSFSRDGDFLAAGGDDRALHIWETRTDEEYLVLQHGDRIRAVRFSPDGNLIAVGGDDGIVQLWDLDEEESHSTLIGHGGVVLGVAFSPGGRLLASASNDATVRLWDARAGTSEGVLEGHEGWVRAVAFSPDGCLLASAGDEGTVRIWDVQRRALLSAHCGHRRQVVSLAFSPDGQTLASAGDDATVRLWDPISGTLRATIAALQEGWVAFTPDGRYKVDGRVGGAFWYTVGLCRFSPGELDAYMPAETLRRLEPGALL
jgi:WD40 repeat protein/3',5'-cyclic AMP phosphodiesterase CpdA